jgi:hypothetical protein
MPKRNDTLWSERPPEPAESGHERLVGLRASVSDDGDATSFAIQFTNQPAFKVHVPLPQIVGILDEIRYASETMVNRQQIKLDRGASVLLGMCETALRPAVVQILIDPMTQDRLFILQFTEHAPLAFRVSALELPLILNQLAATIARSLH